MSQASEAMYYMSLAGWEAADMLDGLDGVMDLAAASGEDLGLVSDIVTDGLTAFGLSAKESARMADILASASSNANTDVAGLGQAFSYVAPVAGAMGYTMEDTSKAIGLMANAGIKSTKAGTALRTMMTNLAKPTKEMKKAMDKYGISLTDSNGEMKSFDDVMKDLRKGLGKLDKDQQAAAASTIFGKEAMSGALAIVNASEDDYKKLSKAINESEGSAKQMADVMQDNLQGSLKELKSKVEDLFITMYKNLKPTLEKIIDGAKNLTEWFAKLSPKTQENIIKFGLMAAAAGPVLSIVGKLTGGLGSILGVMGKVTKAIGIAKGAGLVAGLASLGPLAIGGIAVAGLVGIGVAVSKLFNRKKKLNEINTETAEKLYNEAQTLEGLADEYDKLTGKSKLTKDEFIRLVDVQKELNDTSDPQKLEKLQSEFDKLQKKSGLSADEVDRLVDVNDDLIEQTPNVEKTMSERGNAVVDNTDVIRDNIKALYDLSIMEFEGERVKALENEKKIREENVKLTKKLTDNEKEYEYILDNRNLSLEEIDDRLLDINKKYDEAYRTGQDTKDLETELELLQKLKNDNIADIIDSLQKERDEIKQNLSANEEELATLEAMDEVYKDMLLGSIGIKDENGKGLKTLDKQLDNLKKQKKELEKNTSEAEKHTEGYKEKISLLDEEIDQHETVKKKLKDELNLTNETNKKTDEGVKKEKERTKEAGKGVAKDVNARDNGTIDLINKRATEGKDKQVSMVAVGVASLNNTATAPKNKNVSLKPVGALQLNRTASEAKNKNVHLKAQGASSLNGIATAAKNKNVHLKASNVAGVNYLASKPVTKTVNFKAGRAIGSIGIGSLIAGYAKGTPAGGHKGGHAIMGEAGRELVTLPSGQSFLTADTATFYPNLPPGTHVTPHQETNRILKSIPRYADGTSGWLDALSNSELFKLLILNDKGKVSNNQNVKQDNRILNAILQQNAYLKKSNDLLVTLINKDTNFYLDSEQLGKGVSNTVTKQQNIRTALDIAKLGG